MKYFCKQFLIIFSCLIFFSDFGYSFTDQATTERIIKENRYFIDFINVSVSNFAINKKDDFKTIYEKHFNAEVAYLQFDYIRAYKRIYASQGDMVKLYEYIFRDHYLEASKKILDTIAPDIIKSKNPKARLYLTLGYRDRTVSWTHYVSGTASNPTKYSYKLFKYEEAIKMARRAKRYAFLALFESQSVKRKYAIYNYLLKKEKETNVIFFNRFLDLSEEDMIKEMNKSYEQYLGGLEKQKESNKNLAFEKNVEKRVRFRNENRAARYLLNREFNKAEDIMRKYIDEFNFKLTSATFDVMAQGDQKTTVKENTDTEKADKKTTDEPVENSTDNLAIDVKLYKVHLLDNYLKLMQTSILQSVMHDVKIDDDIGKFKIESDDIPPIISKEEYDKIKKEETADETIDKAIDKDTENKEKEIDSTVKDIENTTDKTK